MTDVSTQERTLVLRRTIAAPRDRIFAMWTEPERIRDWMCPPECKIEKLEADVRDGGTYRIHMRQPNGEVWTVRGMYREVRAPERLAFTWAWEEDDPKDEIETLISIDLADAGDKTDLIFTQSGFATVESRDGHGEGWNAAIDRLVPAL
jgi:uncharacterized protein YndB with AHSA1/START domain